MSETMTNKDVMHSALNSAITALHNAHKALDAGALPEFIIMTKTAGLIATKQAEVASEISIEALESN